MRFDRNYLVLYSLFFVFVVACFHIHSVMNISSYCSLYDIFAFRAVTADEFVEESLFKLWCFVDAIVIAVLFFPLRNFWTSLFCKLLGGAFFLVELADFFCIYEFSTRFDFTRVFSFSMKTDNGDSLYFLIDFLTFIPVQICLILFIGLVIMSSLCRERINFFVNILSLTVCFVILFACGVIQKNVKTSHWLFTSTDSNFLYNYSSSYAYKNYNNSVSTYKGLNSRKNIIIVVVESLSSYMSSHFYPNHGLGYTPFVDSLAKSSMEFDNYSCTAFNSSENMYSIISGYPYIHNNVSDGVSSYTTADMDDNATLSQYRASGRAYFKYNFVDVFISSGYKVSFFHGGELVYGMDSLMSNISPNVTSITGDSAEYINNEKFVFNSVTDEVLYNNVLRHIEMESQRGNNYLYVVRTVTSHNPYIDPISKTSSVELSIRFADNALKHFVDGLNKNNFFNNGILVVLGDHRAMQPQNTFENKDLDITRVPMIIKRQKAPEHLVITNRISHQSLGNILEYLALDEVYKMPHQINPLVESNKSETVLYRSYAPTNELIVVKDDNSCKFILDGDNSALINCSTPEILKEEDNIKSFVYYLLNGCR